MVANDPFNSHPSDPELMSEEVRKNSSWWNIRDSN
jgi:Mg-chelatase subunit ChlI